MARENELVAKIGKICETTRTAGVRLGVGDDAALLAATPGLCQVLTVDAFAEGTHFRSGELAPEEIGELAASAAVSDAAAMAAEPRALLLSLHFPRGTDEGFLLSIIEGAAGVCRRHGAALAGGNLCAAEKLSLDVTVAAEAAEGMSPRRTGAKAGDEIWVTGGLGRGAARNLWLRHGRPAPIGAEKIFPRARVAEARFLCRNVFLRAMLDISDGLVTDLARLGAASGGLGAELEAGAVPVDGTAETMAAFCGTSALEMALYGGEDYELCFCSPPGGVSGEAAAQFVRRFGIKLSRLGRMVLGPSGIRMGGRGLDSGAGFDHLAGGRRE